MEKKDKGSGGKQLKNLIEKLFDLVVPICSFAVIKIFNYKSQVEKLEELVCELEERENTKYKQGITVGLLFGLTISAAILILVFLCRQ